ncbi:MAG: hypothetical protein JWM34_2858 [Ilumatobacteraceae bacterium]|nr:hypothetical protein [Ilumatobacteraceae bacterium]
MTPIPAPGDELLGPPSAAEVELLGRGVLSAISAGDVPTEFQALLVEATFEAMTGLALDATSFVPISPDDFADGLASRNVAFRTRILQIMILGALVVRPLPVGVADDVAAFARAMSVDDGMLQVARDFAADQLGLAAVDFDRNGYTADWSTERTDALHATGLAEAWSLTVDDPVLAARWAALGDLPRNTLGRRVWEFYEARGFVYPGLPGSAPPLLAQHDWVHVLADYGSTVESELEVFAFIARANDDPRGFSLLAMVVSLFETGYLAHGAGLFDAFPGQLSRAGMAVRVADAMRRGALGHGIDGAPDVDFLAIDWFTIAGRPLDELRERFGIGPKSAGAIAAGSVGPWEPGGISEYQFTTASAAAGDAYDAYGACV